MLLLPLSLLINLTMPDLNKKRTSFAYLYWGLILVVVYNIGFGMLLLWIEEMIFLNSSYDELLMGLVINSLIIALPFMLYNFSIYDSKLG